MSKKDTQQIKEMKAKLLRSASASFYRNKEEFSEIAKGLIEFITEGYPDRDYCRGKLYGWIMARRGYVRAMRRRNYFIP